MENWDWHKIILPVTVSIICIPSASPFKYDVCDHCIDFFFMPVISDVSVFRCVNRRIIQTD